MDWYDNGGPKWLQELKEQDKENYIDSWIENNVTLFWKDKPQLAIEYLKERNVGYHSSELYIPEFSHEFWIVYT